MNAPTPLIDIRPDHWEIVRSILHKHVPQYEVWAFGSRATWKAKEYSDLDLAIITDRPLSLDVSASLSDDFSESELPWRVDVVDWATTGESFRNIIERDKVVVQEGAQNLGITSVWRSVPLIDLTATPPTYGVVQPGQNSQDGVPMVRVNNFQGHSLNLAEVMRISPEVEAKYVRTRIQKGDVLITVVGSVGQVAIVPSDLEGWNIARAVAMVRPKDSELSRWIALVLRSPDAQYRLGVAANTTVQITVNLKDLRQLQIPFPEKSERNAIAHILGTLDDKIELNRKQNETLEAMARALFKAWFVDFEPVRAKMEGRWQRGQSLPGLPAHLYDLFPDRLVESELGEIPEEWRVGSSSDAVEIIGGGTPKTSVSEYWNGEIPWFSVVDTPAASDVFVVQTEKSITQAGLNGSSARLITKGTTIISARGTVGNLAIAGCDMTFNQSCYALRGKNGSGIYFVFLSAQRMVEQLKAMAHGSVFSTITRQTFEAVRAVLPPENVLQQFEKNAAGLLDPILVNVNESRSLAQLRDTLLPKLISGELRVNSESIKGGES